MNEKIVCEFCNLQTIISEEDLALLRNSKTDRLGNYAVIKSSNIGFQH